MQQGHPVWRLAIAHITQALYAALSAMVEHGVVVVAPKAGANALALVIAPMKGLSSISELDLTNQSKPDLRDHLSNIDEICPGSRRRSLENCFAKPLKVR
jgi:hypothetical protein